MEIDNILKKIFDNNDINDVIKELPLATKRRLIIKFHLKKTSGVHALTLRKKLGITYRQLLRIFKN